MRCAQTQRIPLLLPDNNNYGDRSTTTTADSGRVWESFHERTRSLTGNLCASTRVALHRGGGTRDDYRWSIDGHQRHSPRREGTEWRCKNPDDSRVNRILSTLWAPVLHAQRHTDCGSSQIWMITVCRIHEDKVTQSFSSRVDVDFLTVLFLR